MTCIHWVRHGPTHLRTFCGWTDAPADLSETAALDRLSAALPPDAVVVSSDLARAADTATAIAGARKRLPHLPDLREFNFGAWEGAHWTDIDGDAARAFWDAPGDIAPPGGESWNAVDARVRAAVTALRADYPGPLVIVAHMGVILTQLRHALGCSPYQALSHEIAPLSRTVIHDNGPVRGINLLP